MWIYDYIKTKENFMWSWIFGEFIDAYKREQTDMKIRRRTQSNHNLYEINGTFNEINTDETSV